MKILILIIASIYLTVLPHQGAIAQERVIIASSSNMNAETNGSYVWTNAFIKSLEESGFKPVLFPASSLGRVDARTDLLQLNLLHVNITADTEVYHYSNIYSGLKYAFLFDNNNHYIRFFYETKLMERVNEEIKNQNMRLIDTIFLGGMSGLFNTKKNVETIEDLQGLRIRGSDSMELLILNSWDVNSTQVAWEEIAQALETGIADGYLNPPLVPLMFGHTRQIKYFTNLRVNPSTRSVVIADKWYQNLKPERRKLFDKAVITARAANHAWAREVQIKELELLHAAGVKTTEISQENRQVFIFQNAQYMKNNNLLKIDSITSSFIESTRMNTRKNK